VGKMWKTITWENCGNFVKRIVWKKCGKGPVVLEP
jgi:hypothetical protein